MPLSIAETAPQASRHHASAPHPTGLSTRPIPCEGPEKMSEKRGHKAARDSPAGRPAPRRCTVRDAPPRAEGCAAGPPPPPLGPAPPQGQAAAPEQGRAGLGGGRNGAVRGPVTHRLSPDRRRGGGGGEPPAGSGAAQPPAAAGGGRGGPRRRLTRRICCSSSLAAATSVHLSDFRSAESALQSVPPLPAARPQPPRASPPAP